MIITKYDSKFDEQIKDLLVELQEYIVSIDKYNLNILSKDYREKYFEKTLNEIKNNQGQIFIAIENNFAIGMISCFVENYDEFDKLDYKCPKKGIISELVVSKKYRSFGIGHALIEAAEKYLKNQNCEFVQLDLFSYNETAENFYKRHGYEERMITLFKKIK